MIRSPRFAVLPLSFPFVVIIAACGGGGGSDDTTSAEAHVTLVTVPDGASCARITATADSTVTQDFTVTPGTAHLDLSNVPLGSVQFYASAFPSPCPIVANTVPTWVSSAPASLDVHAGTVVEVTLDLVRNTRACATTATTRAVTSAITLPLQPADDAFDLDGDGNADNRYASLTHTFDAQGFDNQAPLSASIASGAGLLLFEETSTDPAFAADATCASVKILDAVTAAPDFSGNGHFTADSSLPTALLSGAIQAGAFTTSPPPTGSAPPAIHVVLPFVSALAKVPLTVLHATLTNASGAITHGQVSGVIKATDMKTVVIPAIATGLSASVQANPSSAASKQIVALLDTGNCTNDGGAPALVDGVISPCEVAGNASIASLLAPDVRIFDATGNYAPSATAEPKDGFSVGFHFTAVAALP